MTAASTDTLLLACELSEWQGDPHRCRWCNDTLLGRQRRWCSPQCVEQYKSEHWWDHARDAALTRDRRSCRDCSYDPAERPGLLEVHHLTPVQGHRGAGCQHHVAGLVTLCQHHHEQRHRAGKETAPIAEGRRP